jgi:hypothetical protein
MMKMEFKHDFADEFEKQYCLGNISRCARYMVYKALLGIVLRYLSEAFPACPRDFLPFRLGEQ